jgi:hypothetical protein
VPENRLRVEIHELQDFRRHLGAQAAYASLAAPRAARLSKATDEPEKIM